MHKAFVTPTWEQLAPGACAVYRIFDDCDRLIYVGCSSDPSGRIGAHMYAAYWRREISYWTVEWFATHPLAHDAEIAAIQSEDPDYNFQHTERARIFARTPLAERRAVRQSLIKARIERADAARELVRAGRRAACLGSPEGVMTKVA